MEAQRERRRAVFAWGEDKCGELGKTSGERRADAFRGRVEIIYRGVLFTQLQRSAEASYTHKQGLVNSGEERQIEAWIINGRVFICKWAVFIKHLSLDLWLPRIRITCLHSPFHAHVITNWDQSAIVVLTWRKKNKQDGLSSRCGLRWCSSGLKSVCLDLHDHCSTLMSWSIFRTRWGRSWK